MTDKRTFFFYLSGELQSDGIPTYEVISILKSYDIKIKKIRIYDQVLLISSNDNICGLIAERASYLHRCGLLIFNILDPNFNKIKKKLQQSEIDILIKKNISFAVRIKKIKTYFSDILVEKLEGKIGHLIKNITNNNIKVDLKNPEIVFYGIFTENNFIFGISLNKVKRREIRQRAPHTRPFFHPCGLDPFLARAMVNLSEINHSKVFYDPFCGSGSLLIEAALMGFKVIGTEIDQKMLKGSILNLRALNIQDFYIIRSDARKPSLNKINCLVTDPPYGRSTKIELGKKNTSKKTFSSTINIDLINLLLEFFRSNVDIIEKKSICIMALPSSFNLNDIALRFNFKIENEFIFYVHRSLTRKIFVLRKM